MAKKSNKLHNYNSLAVIIFFCIKSIEIIVLEKSLIVGSFFIMTKLSDKQLNFPAFYSLCLWKKMGNYYKLLQTFFKPSFHHPDRFFLLYYKITHH